MLKTKIKNIILLTMVLLCIYLSSNVWLKLPEFLDSNTIEDGSKSVTVKSDVWKVLRPVKTIIKYSDSYSVFYSNNDELWRNTLNAIKTAFLEYSNSTVIETAAFPSEYLKFDFNTNIPIEIFIFHMEVQNENINNSIKSIKNIIIDLKNNNSLYIYNGESTFKIINDKIDISQLTYLAQRLNSENMTEYLSGQKILDEVIQVPVPLETTVLNPVFVQSELDVFDIDRINEIAKNYFRNDYDYVRKSVEVSGNLVYVYRTEKILKINEEGLLDFYDASIEPENGLNVYKSFIAAVNFTEEFLGFPESVYLSDVENIYPDGNEGYRFTFSYNILDRPILFSRVRDNSALQIDVIGGNVISYKRFIRKVDNKQMDKMTQTSILPVIDVIYRNIDDSTDEPIHSNNEATEQIKPIKPKMIKEINNIYLGYFDLSRISKEQVLRVVWVVETNEKTFIFNAITGALIEEW